MNKLVSGIIGLVALGCSGSGQPFDEAGEFQEYGELEQGFSAQGMGAHNRTAAPCLTGPGQYGCYIRPKNISLIYCKSNSTNADLAAGIEAGMFRAAADLSVLDGALYTWVIPNDDCDVWQQNPNKGDVYIKVATSIPEKPGAFGAWGVMSVYPEVPYGYNEWYESRIRLSRTYISSQWSGMSHTDKRQLVENVTFHEVLHAFSVKHEMASSTAISCMTQVIEYAECSVSSGVQSRLDNFEAM